MNTAWFNLGSIPGNIGNVIITGHYGRWKNGSGSVFDHLDLITCEGVWNAITKSYPKRLVIYTEKE